MTGSPPKVCLIVGRSYVVMVVMRIVTIETTIACFRSVKTVFTAIVDITIIQWH